MEATPRGAKMQLRLGRAAGRGQPSFGRFLGGGVGVLIVLMLGALIPSPAVAAASGRSAAAASPAPPAPVTSRAWQREAPLRSGPAAATPTVTCPAKPTVEFSVTDTVGDAFGTGPVRHDITSVSATADAATFCLTVNFAGVVAPADSGSDHALVGFIEF